MSRNFAEQTGCGAVTVWYGMVVLSLRRKLNIICMIPDVEVCGLALIQPDLNHNNRASLVMPSRVRRMCDYSSSSSSSIDAISVALIV